MWKSFALVLVLAGSAFAQDVDALRDGLSDVDAVTRARAARQLGEVGKDAAEAVPDLVEALSDWTPAVRKAATLALGRVGVANEDVTRNLERIMRSRIEDEAEVAVAAAALLRGPLAPALTRMFEDPAFTGLARKGVMAAGKDAAGAMRAMTTSTRWRTRVEAASMLGAIGAFDDATAERLAELASGDPVEMVRQSAMAALSRLSSGSDSIRSALRPLLTSSDESARLTALAALIQDGVPAIEQVESLEIASRDESADVRLYAVRAVYQRGNAHVVLVTALADADQQVRVEAARALHHRRDVEALVGVPASDDLAALPAVVLATVRSGEPSATAGPVLARAALNGHGLEWVLRFQSIDDRLGRFFTPRRNLRAGGATPFRVPPLPAVPGVSLDDLVDGLRALGNAGSAAVARHLDAKDTYQRALALLLLTELGTEAVEPHTRRIASLLSSESEEVRTAAAMALAGRSEGRGAVVRILVDGALATNHFGGDADVIRDAPATIEPEMWRAATRPALSRALAALDDEAVADPATRKALFRLARLDNPDDGTRELVETASELLQGTAD